LTSRDAVDLIARLVRKTKVGHAGTLDPLATGVLVICVGAATRLIEYVQRMPKTYRTVIRLGARSDTLDSDGEIVEAVDPHIPSADEIRAEVAKQVGVIEQVPPQFSALKVGGQRAYDLARAGQSVTLAARPVTIERIDVLGYVWPRLELEVACGSGTYIRSIARDVGDALGCGGLIEVLTRTQIGPFRLGDAVDPYGLNAETLETQLQPSVEAVAELRKVGLSADQVGEIAQGRSIQGVGGIIGAIGEVALIGPDGELVGIGAVDPLTARVAPSRVFVRG
jgi:tRNA pseudouridine55 synthase